MMNSSFARYEDYQDSEIAWIGAIPTHWNVTKIKRLSNVRRGASPRPIDDPRYFDDDNGRYGWVRIEDVTKSLKYLLETKQKLSPLGSSKSVKMKPDDIFLSIAGSVGKPIITQIDCCIHDGFVYFVGLKQHNEFMYYVFNCANIFTGLGKVGTQLNLNTQIVGSIDIPVPPLSEQIAIADYLDTKTAQIDRKIDLLTQKADKYRELRQTLINETVTRGLDKTAVTKDSGIDWLGRIPAHWEVTRMKEAVTKIGSGVTPRGGSEVYTDSGILFLRSQNVYDDGLHLENVSYIPLAIHESMKISQLKPNDILVNITGASIGRTCIVPANLQVANINQHIAFLRIKKLFYPAYISQYLKSSYIKNHIQIEQNGASKEAFNLGQIANIPLVLPSIHEQKAIVSYLEVKTAHIDQIISTINHQIEKLQELRKTLINEVVTGQIKVT